MLMRDKKLPYISDNPFYLQDQRKVQAEKSTKSFTRSSTRPVHMKRRFANLGLCEEM